MFDNTLDVHWGLTVDSPNATPVAGKTTITDATRSYAFARTGFEAPLWPAGLSTGDFDGDGDDEALILSYKSLYELETDGAGGYRQSWMYPFTLGAWPEQYRPSQMTAIATGDTDGDGKHEIFVAAGDQVFALDGVERRVANASTSFAQSRYCLDLELANLDGTGEAELVCLLSGYSGMGGLVVLGADDLGQRFQFPDADYGTTIDVGNVDADAALEIVTAKGYVFDGATFENEWLYTPGFGTVVDTGDLDGDGVAEIVANASGLTVYSAAAKSPLWQVAASAPASLIVTNIDADPPAEIVAGDGQWGNVTAYECNAQCTGADIVFQISSQDLGVSAIGAGDFDHDGEFELIWGTGTVHTGEDKLVIAGRNPDIEVEWITADPSQLDGAFTGGELAGTTTVPAGPLFATASTDSGYAGTRLIRMDPATGDIEVSAELGSNWNRVAVLTVSDYDNDGVHEAFLGTAELYDAYLTVYDFFDATAEWTSPQYGSSQAAVAVAHADVTGDGRDELVAITTQGVVLVHDVATQTLVWQSTTLNGGRDVIVEDLDDDGSKDILVVTMTGLYLYERSAGPVAYLQTATYFPPTEIRDAVVTDADGDGDLDVLVLEGPSYSFAQESTVERLDASLQPLGSFDVAWRAESLFVEPGPAGARRNVIVPTVGDFLAPPSEIVALDAVTGNEVWRSPRLLGQVAKDSVHFVDVGGETRLSVGTQRAMYLTR
ncbi:MAG TPA: VCBS repeat-containing protein [Gammaproteobacteria bacterium]